AFRGRGLDRRGHGRLRHRPLMDSRGASDMDDGREQRGIVLPAPTAWPMILAFGITLIGAGYLMHPLLAGVGVAAVLAACVGWFREVLPVEHEEVVPLGEQEREAVIEPSPRKVQA